MMPPVVPLDVIDVELYRVTPEQKFISLAIAFIVGTVFLYLLVKYRRPTLPSGQKRHATRIGDQLSSVAPTIKIFTSREDISPDALDEAWRDDESHLRAAVTAAKRSLARLSVANTNLPLLSVRLGQEAVLTTILGLLATASAVWIENQVSSGGTMPTITPAWVAEKVIESVDFIAGVFHTAPMSEFVQAMVIAHTIEAYHSAYSHYKLVATILVLGAIASVLLDRRDVGYAGKPSARRMFGRVGATLALTWLVGALLMTIGAFALVVPVVALVVGVILIVYLDITDIVMDVLAEFRWHVVGVAMATTLFAGAHFALPLEIWSVFTALGVFILASGVQTLRAIKRALDTTTRPIEYAHSALHLGFSGLAFAILPLLAAWTLTVMQRHEELAMAFATASEQTIAAMGTIVLIVLGVWLYRARVPLAELAVSMRGLLADRSLRSVLFARGVPVTFTGLVFLAASFMGLPPAMVIAIALVFGLAARLATYLYSRARYRVYDFELVIRYPWVIVELFELDDDNGETFYAARVNGRGLLARDRDALLDQAAVDARAVLETDEGDDDDDHRWIRSDYGPEPSMAHGRYVLAKRGIVDDESHRDWLDGQMLSEMHKLVDDHDGEKTTIDREMLDKFPAEEYERLKNEQVSVGRLSTYQRYEFRESPVFAGGD